MKISKGLMGPEKIKCEKCGEWGYVKIDKKPSGRYLRVLHIRECYIGRVEEVYEG